MGTNEVLQGDGGVGHEAFVDGRDGLTFIIR